MEDSSPKHGKILSPDDIEGDTLGKEKPNILALINSHTDRPDLFLNEVEKHDPGFIKRMNESANAHSEQLREGKFNFGKRQAYTSLTVQVVSALTVLGVLAYAVVEGTADFWLIIALGIFYAVTQGGTSGFSKIISACSKAIAHLRRNENQN